MSSYATKVQNGEPDIILIYLLSLSGGAGLNAVVYANNLACAGHKVILVCGTTKGERLEDHLSPNISLHRLGVRRNLRALPGLTAKIRVIKPPRALVIGPSNMLPFIIASTVARFRGEIVLRVADSPLGMQALYPPIKRQIKRLSFSWALTHANRVIALTRAMAEELETVWKVPKKRIQYIPNGVKIPKLLPVRCPDEPPILLCVARLVPQKDHDTLMRAFSLLHQNRDCRLILAGEGRERKQLEALAQTLRITPHVTFLGYVRDVTAHYARARAVVLSSRHEGFPNVLIEALAHGCPVVATDCPTGPSEIIDSCDVGELARVGDPNDLAKRLEAVLDRQFDEKRLRMRAEAFSAAKLREKVLELFAPDQSVPK